MHSGWQEANNKFLAKQKTSNKALKIEEYGMFQTSNDVSYTHWSINFEIK